MADRRGWVCLVCLVKMSNSRFSSFFWHFFGKKGQNTYFQAVLTTFGGKKFEFNVTARLKVKFLIFGHLRQLHRFF